jgi:ABC-type glycerol-3-phosphate transport system substrate-binding protein
MQRGIIACLRSLGAVLFAGAFFCSCSGNKTAIVWTDRPEFAFYGEYFNAAQDQYKVEVRYFDFPAGELKNAETYPDIAVGSWLKSASTRVFFKSLDSFFGDNKLAQNTFYPRLLAIGSIDRTQYLLPVSFNAPALVFAKDKGEQLSNPFIISFDEIKKLSKAYNIENNGTYTRMGFSPFWDDDFLFIVATLFDASFREAAPLAWDAAALEQAMNFINNWISEVNTNIQAEEDFTFKYFFDPPAKLAQSGRILFTHMNSDELFTLAEDQRNNLDFRWIAERNVIPLTEGSVYLGLIKKGKAPKAAAAFIRWFFQSETQRQILERSRASRMNETSFGIAGGFSALRPVTEQIFPQFYGSLLGHIPPGDFLSPANILPGNWMIIKERLILPYLRDQVRSRNREGTYPLERRIGDWQRVNK